MDFPSLLCLSATPSELQPLYEALAFVPVGDGSFPFYRDKVRDIFLLHTGIAKVNTAYSLARAIAYLQSNDIELSAVLQCGIGGSFDPELAIGNVLLASSEMDMDAGIRYAHSWQGIEALGFTLLEGYANQLPINKRWTDYLAQKLQLACVPFATSDAITGDKEQAKQQQQYSKASIESMEGSAAAQVCQHFQLAFAELRSISNYVGVRDKRQWNIPLAIKNLNHYTLRIINMLE